MQYKLITKFISSPLVAVIPAQYGDGLPVSNAPYVSSAGQISVGEFNEEAQLHFDQEMQYDAVSAPMKKLNFNQADKAGGETL